MIERDPNSNPQEPEVLTEQEAVRYLRLDEGGRSEQSALRALRRLVETKRIRPARIGLRSRYAREELRRFVLCATELAGEAPCPASWGRLTPSRPTFGPLPPDYPPF